MSKFSFDEQGFYCSSIADFMNLHLNFELTITQSETDFLTFDNLNTEFAGNKCVGVLAKLFCTL